MNKTKIKANARRKLKEFHRWQRVASNLTLSYDKDFRLQVEGEHFPKIERLQLNKETADLEMNAIEAAINSIPDQRQRQILILRFLDIPRSNKEIFKEIKSNRQPYTPLKESQFYNVLNLALLNFARHYREGVLETYED